MVDGPNSRTTSLYLSDETRERLRALAERDRRSMSSMAELALEIGLKRLEKRKERLHA